MQVVTTDEQRNKVIDERMNHAETLSSQAVLKITDVQPERKTKWNRLSSIIRKHGILKFTWLVFRHVLRKTIRLDWESAIIIEGSLEEPVKEFVPKIEVRIEQATEDNLDKLKGIITKNDYNIFKERFRKGRICFVALDGEKIVAYSWINLDAGYVSDYKKEEVAYSFDTYVSDEYRNSGIAVYLQTKIWIYLRDRGYKKVIASVAKNNLPAKKAWRKVGFQGKQTSTLLIIFGLKFRRWQKYTRTL